MSSLHIRLLGDTPASIWALNASQVRDTTASLSPTPGGGAISVFTAALGLALVHKGVSISLKRVGEDSARREILERLCEQIDAALESISALADEDSQAFKDYIEARSLPRNSEEEQTSRSAAMEASILRATGVPISSARHIDEALGFAELALKLSDHHLLTDVFGGAILMQAAAKAVLLNVGANVLLLQNQETRAGFERERAELERLCAERGASLERAYQARMIDSKEFT